MNRSSTGPVEVPGSEPTSPDVGSKLLGSYRLVQALLRAEGCTLFLADDEERSELVLLATSRDEVAFQAMLDGPAAGPVLHRTRLGPWHIAVVALGEAHIQRFGELLFANPTRTQRHGTLPSTPGATQALVEGELFVDRYRVETMLGRGGMGEVYGAFDQLLERHVALKLVRVEAIAERDRDAAKERLLSEARVVCGLRHKNIVELFDAGERDGVLYLVLERCAGSLRPKVGVPDVPRATRMEWLLEVAEGLAFAHRQGIVHRDIKPENILITADGVAKIGDFGIAKAFARGSTESFSIVGTPRYMAPEQLMGGNVDGRADQYAWALLAEELLTGSHPRSAETGDRGAPLPQHLAKALSRATSSDPRARFRSLEEVIDAVRAGAPKSRLPRPAARALIAMAALVLVGVAVTLNAAAGRSAVAPPTVTPAETRRMSSLEAIAALAPEHSREAVSGLQAGVQLWLDASTDRARAKFAEVATRDPSLAEAHVLLAIASEWTDSTFRDHVKRAIALRRQLHGPFAQILAALEPLLDEPQRYEDSLTALNAAAAASPDDLIISLARFTQALRMKRGDLVASRAGETAPAFLWMRARTRMHLVDFPGARRFLEACNAQSPTATDCLEWLARIDARQGNCEALQTTAKKLIALDPTSLEAYRHLARGLAGGAAAESQTSAALRPVLERGWSAVPEGRRAVARMSDEYALAVLDGDLDGARRALDSWSAAGTTSVDIGEFGLPGVYRAELEFEAADHRRAAEYARRFAHESVAWLPSEFLDARVEALHTLYVTGAIARPVFVQRRSALSESLSRRGGFYASPWVQWIETYGYNVVTADDARDAIAAMPAADIRIDPSIELPHNPARTGRMWLLAGEHARAESALVEATSWCSYECGVQRVQALVNLGEVFERNGKHEKACYVWGVARRRWKSAPGTASMSAALRLSTKYHCDLVN